MPDQHRILPGLAVPGYFHMDLGHQGTGCIEYLQSALRPSLTHCFGNTVGAEYNGRVVRHLIQFVHENCPGPGQLIYHKTVMHYFVAHVNGRAEKFQCTFHDLDRPVHASAESPRVGQVYFHQALFSLK